IDIQGLAPPGYLLPPFQGWVAVLIDIQGLVPPGYLLPPVQGWVAVLIDIQGLAPPGYLLPPFQGWPGCNTAILCYIANFHHLAISFVWSPTASSSASGALWALRSSAVSSPPDLCVLDASAVNP